MMRATWLTRRSMSRKLPPVMRTMVTTDSASGGRCGSYVRQVPASTGRALAGCLLSPAAGTGGRTRLGCRAAGSGPFYATYAASKAFVLSFAEALRYEMKDSGVTVTALMPGPTDTNFFDRADMDDTPAGQGSKDDPAKVAAGGFEALMAGKDHIVAGSLKNEVQVLGTSVLPDTAKAAIHAKLTEPKQ